MDHQYKYTNIIKGLISILEQPDQLPTNKPLYGLCYLIECFKRQLHISDPIGLIKFLRSYYQQQDYWHPFDIFWFPPIDPLKDTISSLPISQRITFLKMILQSNEK